MNARKNGETLPSPTLKLAFNDNCLPVSNNIGIFSYRVRPFVFNPLQCYKCQQIGHAACSCNAKQRCLRCGEGHSRDDCAAETLRCAGCKGAHRANTRECPLVQHAHEVEWLRSRGLSYREAVIKLKEPSAAVDSM